MADQEVHDKRAAKRARLGEGEAASVADGELHALIDPSLAALRQALALNGKGVPGAVTVPVASPLRVDPRTSPLTANLLDLRVRGRGASEAESCLASRAELASSSGYYAGLSTHEQPRGTLELPVGHAGVRLLLDALYTKRVQLGPVEVVDLLQAASYLQVECCLSAASEFLRAHVCQAHLLPVLRVAQALGLQDLQHVVIETMARSFTFLPAPYLAALLAELGTEAAEALLQRDDLCCPLEPFLIQVLLSPELLAPAADGRPGVDVERLLGCVRWDSMPTQQLRAAALYAQRVRSECLEVSVAVAWRLAEHLASIEQMDDLFSICIPRPGRRAAAADTVWLLLDLGADGALPSESTTASFPSPRSCYASLEVGASAAAGQPPAPALRLRHTGVPPMADLRASFIFMAWSSRGLQHVDGRGVPLMVNITRFGVDLCNPCFEDHSLLPAALARPLEAADGRKSLLLGCYILPRPPS